MNSPVMLIDTHIHPSTIIERQEASLKRACSIDDVLLEASESCVCKMICIGTTHEENEKNFSLVQRYSSLYVALGIHPCEILDDGKEDAKKITKFVKYVQSLSPHKLVAVGEIGLDFYWPGFDKAIQEYMFITQIECALELGLPIIIHSRNAADETLKIVEPYILQGLKGVIHCFGENSSYAKEWKKYNFWIGIGGGATYPANIHVREAIKEVGLEQIILETDSPFMPPQGFRGTINTPSHILTIAHYIADMYGRPLEDISATILENTYKCFPRLL